MDVPQGGVLSPTLFHSYMARLPQPPSGITLFSYADDCIVLSTGPPPLDSIVSNMNSYLGVLKDWFGAESLQLNPEKSSVTLFTSYSKELNTQLPISIQGRPVPTIRQPKLLGGTFDNLLNFSRHAAQIKTKVRKRNNILKALTGTTWGASKEVMLTAYKAICRPILNYAAPVWTPALSDTQWKELHTCQNSALRTATGCHLMSSIDYLQVERESDSSNQKTQ